MARRGLPGKSRSPDESFWVSGFAVRNWGTDSPLRGRMKPRGAVRTRSGGPSCQVDGKGGGWRRTRVNLRRPSEPTATRVDLRSVESPLDVTHHAPAMAAWWQIGVREPEDLPARRTVR